MSRNPESEWMTWMVTLPDPRPALRVFAANYHYFSLNQVAAFSRFLALMPCEDRAALALLADVLHEELGRGRAEVAHSHLFERFAASAGVDLTTLPMSPSSVAPGVRWYVCELQLAFGGSSLPRALATYEFLENSAVETYGPLLQTLRELPITPHLTSSELEFFLRHSVVEVEHAASALELVRRTNFDTAERAAYLDQKALLAHAWERFWTDLWSACRAAVP